MNVQSLTLELNDWIKNWFTFNVMVIVIVIDVVDVIAINWQKKSFTYRGNVIEGTNGISH